MLTLYITPVVYIYMERAQGMFGRKRPKLKADVRQVPEPAGALGDFFGPGTTVGIPFAAQIGVRATF